MTRSLWKCVSIKMEEHATTMSSHEQSTQVAKGHMNLHDRVGVMLTSCLDSLETMERCNVLDNQVHRIDTIVVNPE